MQKKYRLAALGGTFDHFHKGHESLIRHAFSVAERMIIGVTDSDLISHKKYLRAVQSYEKRVTKLKNFLKQIGLDYKAEIIKLHDVFGPTIENDEIDVLVVSPLTRSGAKLINKARVERNMIVLPVEVCHLEKDVEGDHISSTRVRRGEINKSGFVYKKLLKKSIVLNDNEKSMLKDPFGKLYVNEERDVLAQKLSLDNQDILVKQQRWVMVVGDETAIWCHEKKIPVRFYVFDNKTKREVIENSIQKYLPASEIVRVNNSAGVLSKELCNVLEQSLENKKNIRVIGEEDLAILALMLLAPLGTILLYGQPDVGVVEVEVSEEKKEWVRKLVEK